MKNTSLLLAVSLLTAVLVPTVARAQWSNPTQPTAPVYPSYSLEAGISNYPSLQAEIGKQTTFGWYCQGYIDAYQDAADLLMAGYTLTANGGFEDAIAINRSLQYEMPEGSFAWFYFMGLADTYQVMLTDLQAGYTLVP